MDKTFFANFLCNNLESNIILQNRYCFFSNIRLEAWGGETIFFLRETEILCSLTIIFHDVHIHPEGLKIKIYDDMPYLYILL